MKEGMVKMRTLNIKKTVIAGLAAILMISAFVPAEASFAAMKTYKSKGYALKPYRTKDYKPVNNIHYAPLKVKSFYTYDYKEVDMPHLLGTKKGNKKIELQTFLHLLRYWEVEGLGELELQNPQSFSVLPDGSKAYATHVTREKSPQYKSLGIIVEYDLARLRELELNVPGKMRGLRYPESLEDATGAGSEMAEQIRACVKVGPQFVMGHGAAFAYNPKDKHLWFVTKTKSKKTDLRRINMTTLTPDLCVNFTFDKKIAFGNNITFDKTGKVYQFQYSSSKQGKCPKHAVKIYQGTINLKAKKKVAFKLMRNVIKYPVAANHGLQAAGYDYKLNRIYIVSNSAVMSVPVTKLKKNTVKRADVWMTQFDVGREFEDFEVDGRGNYYLLVNKRPEVMTNQNLAAYGLDKSQFNEVGIYVGPPMPYIPPENNNDNNDL